MTDTIRIFVGSDERQGDAEFVLAYSIRQHSSLPVSITWMRAGDPGWTGWKGQPDMPVPKAGRIPGQWSTRFSAFRMAVPELCNRDGRAIYLDSDMLVLGDVAELWRMPLIKPWAICKTGRSDVSVIDCSRILMPSIGHMKTAGGKLQHYLQKMAQEDLLENTIPETWDCLDGASITPATKLIHFTYMDSQPNKPWPETWTYRTEWPYTRSREAGALWWDTLERAEAQ